MRVARLGSLLVAVCVSVCSCGDSQGPTECSQENMVTLVWAYYDDSGGFAQDPRDGATWVSGEVVADPLPAPLSVAVNDCEYSGLDYWHYDHGFISFGSHDEDIVVYSELDSLDVVVRTSAGTIAGQVSLPSEIMQLELSESETLGLGESLTISWPPDDADFCYVEFCYERANSGYEYVETTVAGNTLIIYGSFFHSDGMIWYVSVWPVNGPEPQTGSTGNMFGYGSGYLYYSRSGYTVSDPIQVGDGLGLGCPAPRSQDPELTSVKVRQRLQRLLWQSGLSDK